MRPLRPAVVFLVGLAVGAASRAEMQDALVARDLLADLAPTWVVKLQYAAGPTRRPAVFATVFRLEQVLWIYAPEIGTQAIGEDEGRDLDPGRLAARLLELDRSVRQVTVYPHPVAPLVRQEQIYLNNACVIASLHSLAGVLDTNEGVTAAGLILMAFDTSGSTGTTRFRVNHCLLAYRRDGQWWCRDPNRPMQPILLQSLAVGSPLDPALTALALRQSYPVKSVRLLALSPGTLDHIASNVHWRSLAANK